MPLPTTLARSSSLINLYSSFRLCVVFTMADRRLVLLVQLPIPPVGPEAIEANIPLAAAS